MNVVAILTVAALLSSTANLHAGWHAILVAANESEEDLPRIIELTSNATSNEIEAGESIAIECKVANLGFGRGVGWRRINPSVGSNYGKPVTIAFSNEVESEVPARYSASLLKDPEDARRGLAKLSISNASVEDSGTYLCEIKGATKVSERISVSVAVLPREDSIVFKRDVKQLSNNGEMLFGRNDKGSFSCGVSNVFPKPSIQIVIGHTVIASDAVYVTSVEITDSVDFQRIMYSGTVIATDVAFKPEYNGTLLACEVKLGSRIPVVVGITLSAAPPAKLIDCKATSPAIDTKQVSLICNFEGDPRSKVTWKLPSGLIVSADSSSEAVAASDKPSEKGYVAELIIANVTDNYLGKYEITVQQEGEPEVVAFTRILSPVKKQIADNSLTVDEYELRPVEKTIPTLAPKNKPFKSSSTAVTRNLVCMLLTTLLAILG